MTSRGNNSILVSVGCAPIGSTLVEGGLGEWQETPDPPPTSSSMIAHVRTDDQDIAQELRTAASVNQEGKPAALLLPAHLREAS